MTRAHNFKDLTGKIFGKWTVLSLDTTPSYSTRWVCQCSCESKTVKSVAAPTLVAGTSTSCGCSWKENSKFNSVHWKGVGEISASYWYSIEKHAEDRGLLVLVSALQAWELFLQQDRKCALTGEVLVFSSFRSLDTTASLDRVDSKSNYTIDNIQWIHKDVNRAKWDLSQEKFIEICNKVSQYNTKPFRQDDE